MSRSALTIAVGAMLVLAAGVRPAGATAYIGVGGGVTPHVDTKIYYYGYHGDTPDTLRVSPGYGFEAQFGWESAPWVDIEGCLRYHGFNVTGAPSPDSSTVTHYSAVGFEGGVRLHPRRGLTNSAPYVRFGIGSYSPSLTLSHGDGTLSNDTRVGYFVGIGYTLERTSSYGLDLRATMVRFTSFGADQGVKLDSGFLSVALSVVVF